MRPPVYAESLREFRGLYSSLQQEHHPFDVLPVEALAQVGDGVLDRYELVILPDLGALGAHSAHALDSFVERGGNLLATGSSAFTEDGRAELTSSPAVRRVGEALTGAQLWSTYVTVDEQTDIAQHRYTPSIVPVFGTYARLAWAPEACPRGWVLPQAPYAPPEKCYGHTTSDDPAFGSITRGAGQTTAVPWTIGRTYSEFGTTEVRGLLMAIIQPLASPTVHAALPEQVELIVGRDDEGYVLHLLNLSGARGRSFGPPVPVHGGRIAFRDVNDDASAEALVAGQPLELESGADGTVFIDLPALERFEVVRVRAAS
jgi:hypothetical protein